MHSTALTDSTRRAAATPYHMPSLLFLGSEVDHCGGKTPLDELPHDCCCCCSQDNTDGTPPTKPERRGGDLSASLSAAVSFSLLCACCALFLLRVPSHRKAARSAAASLPVGVAVTAVVAAKAHDASIIARPTRSYSFCASKQRSHKIHRRPGRCRNLTLNLHQPRCISIDLYWNCTPTIILFYLGESV